MGGNVSLNWRTIVAALFSVVLVVGAYVLARGIELPLTAQASTETALLQAIATRDSTGDGLPDWQKALYGIPLNSTTTDYFNLGMTDGEAVARGLIVPKAIADIQVTTSSDSPIIDPSLPACACRGDAHRRICQELLHALYECEGSKRWRGALCSPSR